MNTFKINSIYTSRHRIDRLWFKIIKRTSRTIYIQLIDFQHDYNKYINLKFQIINDYPIQKVYIYKDKELNEEYIYFNYPYQLYNK